ncbi:hypothetical protein N7448_000148 [Penicillium atrosanguineum]|uniref:TMEM205-like domain-containing protein n=1 Tax=Penicillium atrosanguineum TaxID=1132637 RepID=A0A9W9Q307_9EURO|nr:uncharacterized protein N7443_003549 [Penicillium atrosanguineum]KAJ5148570.1 hypothetical protein N7448_000148 [Penicillium atrosanguineum]KAJ5303889.1 hypothetical protein N7443_003549 [Penicillium atrosanguineum]KAJ5323364.1 hypothetical protein N7476_001964 [Penicillium atrosanguineum]
MDVLKTMGNLLPYHLLSYGALLGAEVYQSFVNTKICYQALPMREFITLNKRIFPVYFGCQVGLAALTAATRPPFSIVSLVQDVWSVVPLGVVLVMGSLNWFIYGPRTTTASLVRRSLHENKKNSADPDEGKVHQANRGFAVNHAMSIHVNAIALVATVWYGFSLSASILNGF